MATRAKTTPIEQMNLAELNAIGEKVRARYDDLRAEALHEIRLTMNQYGITAKDIAESLIKRRKVSK